METVNSILKEYSGDDKYTTASLNLLVLFRFFSASDNSGINSGGFSTQLAIFRQAVQINMTWEADAAPITHSCSRTHPVLKPSAGPRTENLQNSQQTSVCRSNMGGDLFAKHRGRRRRRGERERGKREHSEEVGVSVWEVLPHLKTPGGPLWWWWWWWTQSVLHRSDACLLFGHSLLLFLSLSRPPSAPSSHSPSWVLLKPSEGPSTPGSGHTRGGEIPACPLCRCRCRCCCCWCWCWCWWGGVHRSFLTVSETIRWEPVSLSATQTQVHHCFDSRPGCSWVYLAVSQSVSNLSDGLCVSRSFTLCARVCVFVCVWDPIRPVGPHFSCLPPLHLQHWQQDALGAGEAGGACLTGRSGHRQLRRCSGDSFLMTWISFLFLFD